MSREKPQVFPPRIVPAAAVELEAQTDKQADSLIVATIQTAVILVASEFVLALLHEFLLSSLPARYGRLTAAAIARR
jgi:hypothetical protein